MKDLLLHVLDVPGWLAACLLAVVPLLESSILLAVAVVVVGGVFVFLRRKRPTSKSESS